MRCIDGLTLLMMAEHHPRHAVRVLGQSRAFSDVLTHASCAHREGFERVAIPEPDDPPTALQRSTCPLCGKALRMALRHDTMQLQFEDPLPCDFWTR